MGFGMGSGMGFGMGSGMGFGIVDRGAQGNGIDGDGRTELDHLH
jgi:hypothetical protein